VPLGTLGTTTNVILPAIKWNAAGQSIFPADWAALNALVKSSLSGVDSSTIQLGTAIGVGLLFVPGRGQLRLYEGDYIAVDPNTGEVMVIGAATAAAASWHAVANT
jgi:hypothetical protein